MKAEGFEIFRGDVLNQEDVKRAGEGCDYIHISIAGNVAEAAKQLGILKCHQTLSVFQKIPEMGDPSGANV